MVYKKKHSKKTRSAVQGLTSLSLASLLLMFYWSKLVTRPSPESMCEGTHRDTNKKKLGSLRATEVTVYHILQINTPFIFGWANDLLHSCHYKIILLIMKQNKLFFLNLPFIYQKSYLSKLFYIVYYEIVVLTLSEFRLSGLFLVLVIFGYKESCILFRI